MGKIIFFAFVSFVVLVNLCFGQEGLLKAEVKPSLMYGNGFHNQLLTVLKNSQLQPLSFYASYKGPSFNSFITNALIMQAENETLQPKTSFWKQAGVYGLELFAVGAMTAISGYAGFCIALMELDGGGKGDLGLTAYTIGCVLLGSTGAWAIGKLCNHNGSWWKAAIGGMMGSFVGICAYKHWVVQEKKGGFYPESIFFYSAPAVGVTIGFNL